MGGFLIFLAGAMVGTFVGIMLSALLAATKRSDVEHFEERE